MGNLITAILSGAKNLLRQNCMRSFGLKALRMTGPDAVWIASLMLFSRNDGSFTLCHCERSKRARQSMLHCNRYAITGLRRSCYSLAMTVLAFLLLSAPSYAACTNPAAEVGTVFYNSTEDVFQGCTSTGWEALHKKPVDPPATNLISHWTLDETTGTGTAADSGSLANDGTLTSMDPNTDWGTGKLNNALEFDGTDDRVVAPANASYNFNITDSFSQFLWFKKTTDCGSPDNEVMTSRFGAGHLDRTWWLGCEDVSDTLHIGFFLSTDNSRLYSDYAVDDGQWHHGGWVYDGTAGQLRLYLDGELHDTDDFVLPEDIVSTNPFCIGGYDATCSDIQYHFDGLIDDVRVYDRALTSAEVVNLYSYRPNCIEPTGEVGTIWFNEKEGVFQGCTSRGWYAFNNPPETYEILSSGMTAHWKMDETSGTTAIDSAGNNDGSLMDGMNAATDSIDGPVGTALEWDGTDDYISISDGMDNLLDDLANWSFAAWLYRPSSAGADNLLGSTSHGFWIWIDGSDYLEFDPEYFGFPTPAYQEGVNGTSTPILDDDAWTHIAVTRNGTAFDIYKNGSFFESLTSNTSQNGDITGDTPLTLGAFDADSFYWEGAMDDFRIYNRTLSPQEINLLANPGCTNPVADTGTVIYNSTSDVFQGCIQGKWYAFNGDTVTCPSSGLAGHWKLDETSGTTAEDSAGTNDGTLTNMTGNEWTLGVLGNALDFDGTDDNIMIPSDSAFTNMSEWTISAWIKPKAYEFDIAGTNAVGNGGYLFYISSLGQIGGFIDTEASGNGNYRAISSDVIPLDEWTHVTWVYEGDISDEASTRLYINGIETSYEPYDGSTGTNYSDTGFDLYIGNQVPEGYGPIDGIIDDVRIYNRELTTDEIADLYNGGGGCQ